MSFRGLSAEGEGTLARSTTAAGQFRHARLLWRMERREGEALASEKPERWHDRSRMTLNPSSRRYNAKLAYATAKATSDCLRNTFRPHAHRSAFTIVSLNVDTGARRPNETCNWRRYPSRAVSLYHPRSCS